MAALLPIDELIIYIRKLDHRLDEQLVRDAYAFAEMAHREQKRKSGEPYFVHPISVAQLIADLNLDSVSVAAGLLHDVVEDTEVGLETIASRFGEDVATVVDGVTKLGQISFTSKEDHQAENFRKMVVAMAKDLRVILVKLCDRLDNMRTLQHMKPESQIRIARETMDIYAPLAGRLGIQRIKAELEDLAFSYTDPVAFKKIVQQLTNTKRERERYIDAVCRAISGRLAEGGFAADVAGRGKHIYSIHRKMVEHQCDFDQVYDIIAFRICVESVSDCYAALGVVHSRWIPIPNRFKDYIALPKPNNYQALHTAVVGPGRQRIEVQIRTHEMDRVAEHGVAAHWQYKERNRGVSTSDSDAERFGWLRELTSYQQSLKDPAEFLESVKIDLFPDEVYVFTPKGDVHVLPRGATAIDFAYAVHSDIGEHCVGARANGQIVPLRHKLRNGDVIEIRTSPNQQPSKDWLEYCVTSRAKSRIRGFLRAEYRTKSVNLGRELLESSMRAAEMSFSKLLKNDAEMRRVTDALSVSGQDELLLAIGYGRLDPENVIAVLKGQNPSLKPDETATGEAPETLKPGTFERLMGKVTGRDQVGIRVSGVDNVLVRYAKCCNPLPGDSIIGFITRGRGCTIHRRDCQKAFDTDPVRRIDVSWDSKTKGSRPAQVRVMTNNKPGILAKVSQTFSSLRININEATCRSTGDGRACNIFTFPVTDVAELRSVMNALARIDGVTQVERV